MLHQKRASSLLNAKLALTNGGTQHSSSIKNELNNCLNSRLYSILQQQKHCYSIFENTAIARPDLGVSNLEIKRIFPLLSTKDAQRNIYATNI